METNRCPCQKDRYDQTRLLESRFLEPTFNWTDAQCAVKACPVNGGKLVSYDQSKVSNMPGFGPVKVDDTAVAVVAETGGKPRRTRCFTDYMG
ncbi:MAG: hypothetical protein CM1200mP24_08950 [Gammaproteobacteria bacterium]|nr:MAG: hypothetical protein CM1200mP24_08950 [Gammaproteobacteria bacterium]